mgnify:CR=1 FL=1|jgi:hypothetical protein
MQTFIHDDQEYDASLLSSEAQAAFKVLVNITSRQENLRNELDICVAAGKVYTDMVVANLTPDALVETHTVDPELQPDLEEESGEGPDHDWRID